MSTWSVLLVLAAFTPAYIAALRRADAPVIGAALMLSLALPVFPVAWLFALVLAIAWPAPAKASAGTRIGTAS